MNYKSVICCLFAGTVLLGATRLVAQERSMRLTALAATPDKPVLYKLEFNLNKALESKSAIRLQFPGAYDLSSVKIAGSNDIAGGFSFAADSTSITLQRTGLGASFPANLAATVIFGPIKGPLQSTKSDSVRIQIHHDAKGDISNYVVKIQLR